MQSKKKGAGARQREWSEALGCGQVSGGLDGLYRSRRLYSSGSAVTDHPLTLALEHYIERTSDVFSNL